MGDPVGHQQGVELRLFAIVERKDELGPVRLESLQGVRISGWEIPKIALLHIGDIGAALRVKNGDAAIAVAHEGPLGGLVPMQFPDPACGETHVHAGNGFGDLEV